MVLYGITLVPLAEDLKVSDPGLLSAVYADNAAFDSLAQQISHILKLFIERGPDRGYFHDPSKSLFILDTPEQEEAVSQEFVVEQIELNFLSGSRYLLAYM